MAFALRKFMRRIVAIYAVVAVCFIGLNNAHIHLSESHTVGDGHGHDAEFHAAHPVTHHDNIAGGTDHVTDASFVELDQLGNLVHGIDDASHLIFALALFLFVIPVVLAAREQYSRKSIFRINSSPGAPPGARGPP